MRIESRKGILSRKSSVNKNSFYKQKTKDTLPNKLYGQPSQQQPTGIGGMSPGPIGANSYFNKGAAQQNTGALPVLNSRGGVN